MVDQFMALKSTSSLSDSDVFEKSSHHLFQLIKINCLRYVLLAPEADIFLELAALEQNTA